MPTHSAVETLAELFKEADAKGLWFYSPYQQLWFSPEQLRRAHARGEFRWGAVNWRLRDPKERLQEADAQLAAAQRHRDQVAREIEP